VTRILLAAAVVVGVELVASPARAAERQWHAGLDAGYAALFGGASAGGIGGGAHLAYGLSDAFNALVELDMSRHSSVETTVWSGAAGIAYTFDVARIVPYAGLLVGGYRLAGKVKCVETGCIPSVNALGGQVVLGLDYQLDPNWAIGGQLRMHTIFAADPVGVLAYDTTFLRAEYTWGD
jgi:hypothetical protein